MDQKSSLITGLVKALQSFNLTLVSIKLKAAEAANSSIQSSTTKILEVSDMILHK